ncbi:hypothetical protein TBLA_0E01610 [Henningerozyma blattae CBS 6284]|uniref:Pore membrane protein of 33 kDa n=1 Tax=Henningerozyma blattae (strain ATCC 34711 / CBS 6284 / DSM 70876 / NBRC 10599 / NRRL Y-10934 / UCD 77-7) TaxID=1071380 RepID=I2H4B6_HENB6|nr:hypothetical protein TBLA_0E01610 [Tetrapisispora blattae CBS 6284]CCH61218.1 hypothetical protein TBLA_0E01610 [Tetrapisispora blattae CBS 6284]
MVKSSIPPKSRPVSEILKSLQFCWFLGHALVLICSTLYTVLGFSSLYYVSLLGVIESFGIITYQHFILHKNKITFNSVARNDNAQYLGLALLWLFTSRFPFALVPYFMFSLFHGLIYLKTTLLPHVCKWNSTNSKTVREISTFVHTYNDRCMHYVGVTELFILVLAILRAILWFPNSWMVLIFYSIFMKLKYESSKYTKAAFAQWRVRLDGLIAHPSVPLPVKQMYTNAKLLLTRVASHNITTELKLNSSKSH